MSNRRFTFVFEDPEKMAEFAIAKWRDISSEAIRLRGYFAVALSGGKTPVDFYRRLAGRGGAGPRWRKTHVFLVDERFVPDTDKDSNFRMIKETLLDSVRIPGKNIHYIQTDLTDPASAAERYENDIAFFFGLSGGALPEFDLVMLGIGTDGHTASLFPDSAAVREKKRLAIATSAGRKKHMRITLTLPVLNRARNVIFFAAGREKAKVLRAVVKEMDSSLPASLVSPESGRLLFLADSDAGSLLGEKEKKRA